MVEVATACRKAHQGPYSCVMRALFVLFFLASGCSSIRSSAIATGAVRMPAHFGEVSVYAALPPPPGAAELGIVEVHGAQGEAGVENLLPLFVTRVAELGGDIAAIDTVHAVFDAVTRGQLETFYYTCGGGMPCSGARLTAYPDEVVYVVMRGRALRSASGTASGPTSSAPTSSVEPTETGAP